MKIKYFPKSKKFALDDPIDNESCIYDSKADCEGNCSWIEDLEIGEIDIDSEDWIMRNIPKEFKSVLSGMAYDRGHSAGQAEIILILKELVNDLLPAIREFEHNLIEETRENWN